MTNPPPHGDDEEDAVNPGEAVIRCTAPAMSA
jgi:hypothetical protein